MILSRRLKTIADLIEDGASVADIGADHGLLSIALAQRNCKVIMSDNKPLPLAQGKANAKKFSVDKKIEFHLSDGISHVQQSDYIVIAGMGGLMIKKIIEKDLSRLLPNMKLILQPNNNISKLRNFLGKYFIIQNEKIVFEGKFYEIILASMGCMKYTEEDNLFGPCLRKEKSDTFMAKWQKEEQKLMILLSKSTNNLNLREKLSMIRKELYGKEETY